MPAAAAPACCRRPARKPCPLTPWCCSPCESAHHNSLHGRSPPCTPPRDTCAALHVAAAAVTSPAAAGPVARHLQRLDPILQGKGFCNEYLKERPRQWGCCHS